tara:strand:- start:81 stop:710 length:630 start_codon:yes stop_codon:yes gene_type:complete
MTRPTNTSSIPKESGNNYHPDNGTGAQVRASMKDIFQALRTLNAGSGDPSGAENLAAYQPHIDSDTNTLKIRNGANSGFTVLGDVSLTNFGYATLAGSTFTGKVIHNYTTSLNLPSGTTAQRDGTPAVGMIRHNSTLNQFEGYNNGAWGAIGGGAGATGGGTNEVFFESDQTITTSYELSAGKHAHTVSPTINSGVTITVPSGAILVIL